jgi:hypothetical protein
VPRVQVILGATESTDGRDSVAMIGELTAAEIERILTDGHIGRLGVTDGEQIYIFPVSYGYDGEAAYLVSRLGLKVRLMRAHPEVCFEVEEIDTPAHWRTVMARRRAAPDPRSAGIGCRIDAGEPRLCPAPVRPNALPR